jgi:hypothetical protein
MKIIMELSESQYSVLVTALEDYARIMSGQFWVLDMPYYKRTEENGNREEFKSKLEDLKLLAFPELHLHEHYGIGHEKTPDSSKIAYELYKVLRHERWKLSDRMYNTVDSDGPLELSGEPLPKVEVLENGKL